MTTTLVTGGAGFIGSHVCEALLRRGDSVIVLDNFDDFYEPAVKRTNLAIAQSLSGFQLVEGDIREADLLRNLFRKNIDAVIHLAARAGVRPSIERPLLYQDVNVRGTLVLLEELRRHPGCKLIFGSSSSIYGNSAVVPFHEADPADAPISPYAATKRAAELLCRTYHQLYEIDVTCLRFFTVYGPRQRPDLAIHKFARLIESGKSLPILGDGSMKRDYTYVDDIVDGVLLALDRCRGFHVYNLGNSHPVSVNELIALLGNVLGKKARIESLPQQPGDVELTFADLTLSRRELGYEPKIELREGLRLFVKWLHLRK